MADSTAVGGARLVGVERPVGQREGVHAIEAHGGVAVRARHAAVDLGEDDARVIDRGARRVARRPQRAHAVVVGRRQLEQGRVERDGASAEQPGDVGKKDRHEVGATLCHRRAYVGAAEERHRAQPAGHRRRDEAARAGGVQMEEPYALHVAPAGQRVEQRHRRRRGAVDEDAVAALHVRDHIGGADSAACPPRIERTCSPPGIDSTASAVAASSVTVRRSRRASRRRPRQAGHALAQNCTGRRRELAGNSRESIGTARAEPASMHRSRHHRRVVAAVLSATAVVPRRAPRHDGCPAPRAGMQPTYLLVSRPGARAGARAEQCRPTCLRFTGGRSSARERHCPTRPP